MNLSVCQFHRDSRRSLPADTAYRYRTLAGSGRQEFPFGPGCKPEPGRLQSAAAQDRVLAPFRRPLSRFRGAVLRASGTGGISREPAASEGVGNGPHVQVMRGNGISMPLRLRASKTAKYSSLADLCGLVTLVEVQTLSSKPTELSPNPVKITLGSGSPRTSGWDFPASRRTARTRSGSLEYATPSGMLKRTFRSFRARFVTRCSMNSELGTMIATLSFVRTYVARDRIVTISPWMGLP